jgi:two-component system chemotaxis sensor kinase CheA
VVDDSLTARNALQRALAKTDHEVVTAEDGEQAWSLLAANEFDLVITDVQMPNLDGFSLTRRIRETARLESLPVVLVTNLGSAADIAEGAAAGADEYLVKGSYSDVELLRLLERLV